MTAEANTKWDYNQLLKGAGALEAWVADCNEALAKRPNCRAILERRAAYQHTIAFIEYNMREMEINGGNGDE